MSGRAETEMQIQIMTHGEAFCPSTMTKETSFANQLLEEITNNERNEMEEGRMEENEGHDNVEEEQDNKAKNTPFAKRKLLEDDTTNSEKNEMEEGQMQENEMKEGHDNVEEEQDYKGFAQCLDGFYIPDRRRDFYQCLDDFYMPNRRRESFFLKIESTFAWPYCVNLLNRERGQVKENKIKEGQEKVQEEQDNELVMYRRRAVLCRELEQAIEELKIRRLEIGNFWKHALEKDMNIMRILESGSLRFLKQQIQDVWQLLRCKVCLDSDACMVFFPCRHMATCEYCGSFLDQCPVCRTFIEETVKVNKK